MMEIDYHESENQSEDDNSENGNSSDNENEGDNVGKSEIERVMFIRCDMVFRF